MNHPEDTRLLRHGLLGQATLTGAHVDATRAELNTTLPIAQAQLSTASVTATGAAEDCDGLLVAYAGQPYFRAAKLIRLSMDEGICAALAHAYREHGDAMFGHLHGAFSCVIVDPGNSRLLAAVDRTGQHSLYYRVHQDTLYFGSGAGEVLAAAGAGEDLLHQGIYNYLYFHMVPCPGSVYAGLNKLSAAHFLDCQGAAARALCYWAPPFSESTRDYSKEEQAARLRDVLRTAVKNTLPEQGRIGAFLSGGLDSSTVTGVMAELGRDGAEAYSIGFDADGYDEMAFARITAQHFGVPLNEYYVTPEDVVEALPRIATSYDEPFGNSSALPAYFCARMAADNGVGTLLAGDGGDEIFAGNERYVRQNVFERYQLLPAPLRSGLLEPVLRALPRGLPLVGKANSYIEQANTPLPDRLQSYNFLHRHAAQEIFDADFLAHIDTNAPLELQREIYHRPPEGSDLNRMLYLDWQNTLSDNDLRKVSHMCALAGVDVVYPMLDNSLLDFSCQVPSKWKIKGNDLRHFYKHALKKWLPAQTISKDKQGFGLPFGVWMRTYDPLKEMAYDHLASLKQRGFIRADFIDRAIEMHQSEHAAYYGELVWILSVFEMWFSGRPGRSLE
ncbi:MAG: asparagine synthase [Halioglobus sp.]|nr:asparagine synthase [Halioglobus sp.]